MSTMSTMSTMNLDPINLRPVTRYEYGGELMTETQVRARLENELGAILDKSGAGISARLKMFRVIVENREAVVRLLSAGSVEPDANGDDSLRSFWKD